MQPDPIKQPITLVYKSITQADGLTKLAFNLDVYLPLELKELQSTTNTTNQHGDGPGHEHDGQSAVIYFHGGGLNVGNRKSWFPAWLQKRINAAGHIFISADYRLIPSGLSTAHGVLEDIKDVFSFICSSNFEAALAQYLSHSGAGRSTSRLGIDPNRIAVAGTSSGGTCAYLAAKHADPKPKAVLSIYAAGGDFFTSHWLSPKTTVFFRGRELLDPSDYSDWLYPFSAEERSTIISDSPNTYFPLDHPTKPGWPSNPRSKLAALYLQLGDYLDYYTGQHEPSLSASLRRALQGQDQVHYRSHNDNTNTPVLDGADETTHKFAELIPEQHRHLFPQLLVDSSWPPTFFYHGELDSAVPVNETRNMYDLVRKARAGASNGIIPSSVDKQLDLGEVELVVREGQEHSFDYTPDAEVSFKDDFDRMAGFLDRHLKRRHTHTRNDTDHI